MSLPINEIVVGDCREVMRLWPDDSIDCCITSPPYWGLRDYKIQPVIWPAEIAVPASVDFHKKICRGKIQPCEHEWRIRISTAKGQFYVANSTSTLTTGTTQKRKEEVQEIIGMNTKIQTFFCHKCGAWLGSLGLEPSIELYVRHIVEVFREVRRVLKPWGTLWLNIGDSYASGKGTCFNPGGGESSLGKERKEKGTHPLNRGNKSTLAADNLKPKDLCMIPARVALALQADGWWLRQDIIWSKPNPMPESCRDRCTKSHEYLFLLTKSAKYFYDQEAIKEETAGTAHERGDGVNPKCKMPGANSRIYIDRDPAHASRAIKSRQNESFSAAVKSLVSSRNRRSVWTITTQPTPEAHFATFPEKLVEQCIMAGTSEKGCPKCGRPRERIVDIKTNTVQRTAAGKHEGEYQRGRVTPRNAPEGDFHDLGTIECKTIGWMKCPCISPPAERFDASENLQGAEDKKYEPCIVLDPFIGSGTTGKVALRLGRNFVGIEISERYVHDIANWHIREQLTGVTVAEQRKGQKALFV